ncbi:3-isopropylmalate dehydratase large subunit [Domibacillus sp. DTU_2020_1001157_1_SI_ALB_TIR_016]|uniref:3-isopropylmalate dehydratase large subunit n=1 Tax=Domibacillus sp. DTU_2020_1001157_1_SI_ALB_TIR_016 TaxID=3077789 RepID=UPI0028EC4A8D|nr:3-isopropylmalate dehydratase large subunit [Domibacillus sp. DTU_2020_1001157_1_SI_ALB_TIR_016]WNS78708.1 3-isopropylmalate dehydratase large subunit [Domibacillus sp. DTU_2020_1001157_1_SI_ALB_TIR_016]
MNKPKTLFDKVWEKHVVRSNTGEPDLLYIDFHLMHEVTSPHAFNMLRQMGKKVRRPDLTIATMDHQVPTTNLDQPVKDQVAAEQMNALHKNSKEFGIQMFPWGTQGQGIIHVIGPERGLTQPGMVIVCGDSHTSTHGAFGALAFGIGISEVAHVLATQTLPQRKPKTMAVTLEGKLPSDVTAKDLILGILKKIGTDGGVGHVIEFRGEAIRSLSMEGRMTVCNMAIEGGARAGMIAPDEVTFNYLKGKPNAPQGEAWDQAVQAWKTLHSDEGAEFDKEVIINAAELKPFATWGTTPAQSISIDSEIPMPKDASEKRALEYMGLKPGMSMKDIEVDAVFIGSCTNARMEDLRAAAAIVKNRKVKDGVRAIVVPGSMNIKKMAEEEGLADVFKDAGFEWRAAGCSMCVGMNDDVLESGQRCASTSNRNFEGRQGKGARTHLVSPAVAAATAVMGHFASLSDLKKEVFQ